MMPSERRGTVTDEIAAYMKRMQGSTEWKGDKAGTIRAPIAKMHFPVPDVARNIKQFLDSVKSATGNVSVPGARDARGKGGKPSNAITRILLSSTQGPGIQLSDV